MSKYYYEKTKQELWEKIKKEFAVNKRMLTTKTMDKMMKRYENEGGGYIIPDYLLNQIKLEVKKI